mmetsp:Transcript_22777/g.68371  ORF Transcript_22777/g.68371 Transcript_22777/m.68371 type:complete len:204 (-) Transcript_22777:73-684(-)
MNKTLLVALAAAAGLAAVLVQAQPAMRGAPAPREDTAAARPKFQAVSTLRALATAVRSFSRTLSFGHHADAESDAPSVQPSAKPSGQPTPYELPYDQIELAAPVCGSVPDFSQELQSGCTNWADVSTRSPTLFECYQLCEDSKTQGQTLTSFFLDGGPGCMCGCYYDGNGEYCAGDSYRWGGFIEVPTTVPSPISGRCDCYGP